MTILSIDIETYSPVDLKTSGVYKYAEHSDFQILLLAYQLDDYPVQIVDLAQGEQLPTHIKTALFDPNIVKTAHNASFERTCINAFFGWDLPVSQWSCTMVRSSMLGLPLGLDQVATVLGLREVKQSDGKALIRYWSVPCKPTAANGQRTRNLPQHDADKWQKFKDYCIQDVVVERAIVKRVNFFAIPAGEVQLYNLDQKINDAGVLLDPFFIDNAIQMDGEHRARLTEEAIRLTGLNNPNSASQLKKWLSVELGEDVTELRKDDIPDLLASTDDDTVSRVLRIRQELSRTSVQKYAAMAAGICTDGRVRGLLQFYGANRTGRWAGRLVQVQNLPKNKLKDLDLARRLVENYDLDTLQLCFGNVPDVLSQLVRTAFIAGVGSRFIVADFSAIEARVIAWLAGEKWRLDVFKTHGKIYEASAAAMFKVPLESVTKELRGKGKIAELALGYQGGANALLKMGAIEMGLDEAELPGLVTMWRQANKAIVKLWANVQTTAITCVKHQTSANVGPVYFFMNKGTMFIRLPSGRSLAYLRAKVVDSFKGESLMYEGMNQTTKQWSRQDTYGGKLVENIIQAIARDCLADAMLRIDALGYRIVMHVHDEVVIEALDNFGSLAEVCDEMGKEINWAKGLPLRADGFETNYYKKD